MCRTLALAALVSVLIGCTRYGTNPSGGPFSRTKPKHDPVARIPPGPPANSSPLVLASAAQPQPPLSAGDNRLVPDRPPDPVALTSDYTTPSAGITPAGGVSPDAAAAFPPQRRRPEPQPSQLPSPFAPKNPASPRADTPATPKTPAPDRLADVKKLVQTAAGRWAEIDTYEATITRKELTPQGKINEEVVLFQFRKEPMSVFTRNVGENGKGREVVYNPTKHGDKLHVMLGKGDHALMSAGFKAPPVSPDDPRVKEKSRYSLRTAGFGTPIGKVADWVAKAEAGTIPADALTFLGSVNRPEYPYPLTGVSLKLRPGDDRLMPNGGLRQWFFDPKSDSPSFGMPVLITATDAKGNDVEYYLFQKIRMPAGLTEADFTPTRLGKKP